MNTLIIYIDWTDHFEDEYMVKYSDFEVNKTQRFTEYSKEKVENQIKKTLKRNKIKSFLITDTTGSITID